MMMSTIARRTGFLVAAGVFAASVLLSGCPSASTEPTQPAKPPAAAKDKAKNKDKATAKPESSEEAATEEAEEAARKPRDLGPPLVDDPKNLVRLDLKQPVWIDKKNRHVVLVGEVCTAGYPLEFFATYSMKSYESALSVNVTPWIVHTALLRVGAEPGHPAQFQPKFVAPTGTEIAIEVRWKDENGNVRSAPAQNWIRNRKTLKALDSNWVFAGSMFAKDETTGKEYYLADSGELICVLSLPTAMLDLPFRSFGPMDDRSFEAFKEHLPPPETPVTLLLKPILAPSAVQGVGVKPVAGKPVAPDDKRAALEQKALIAVEPWLALVDQSQYTRSWETAAEHLKDAIDRHEFIKRVGSARKSFGEMKSRVLQSKQYATSLPGAPDGQYVVVTYKTTFASNKSATEKIAIVLDEDKRWKVSGYSIK